MALQRQIPGAVNASYVISRQAFAPGAVQINDNTANTAATGTLSITAGDESLSSGTGNVIITGTLS